MTQADVATVTLAELGRRIASLLQRLETEHSAPKAFKIEADAYWTIAPQDALRMETEPTLEVGSLKDDVERLDWSLEKVTAPEIESVASLLRYYARLL